jgi:hypothetical protein
MATIVERKKEGNGQRRTMKRKGKVRQGRKGGRGDFHH